MSVLGACHNDSYLKQCEMSYWSGKKPQVKSEKFDRRGGFGFGGQEEKFMCKVMCHPEEKRDGGGGGGWGELFGLAGEVSQLWERQN
jgi:hypothetical protein